MRNRGAQILWLVILLALVVIMGVLLIGGDILLYLSPRMAPVVWFGFIVLTVLSIYQLWQILMGPACHKKGIRLGSLVFLIPIILILTVTPNDNTSAALPNQNVKLMSMAKNDALETDEDTVSASPLPSQTDEETAEASQSPAPAATRDETVKEETESVNTIDASDALPCVFEEGTAAFDASTDKFSDYLYNSPEELSGKTVTLYGFVYTDESFPKNTVLVSRLFISCCAADASIVGFHVKVEKTDDFADDEWICVQGTAEVMKMEYDGVLYDFPILTDGTITRCEQPKAEEAYIYP